MLHQIVTPIMSQIALLSILLCNLLILRYHPCRPSSLYTIYIQPPIIIHTL
jgi:hypothetical protein